MSTTGRNFVVAYILLVGVPLLALAGVLRAGRSLTAPASIDGTWKLQANPEASSSQPACAAEMASLAREPLIISQSGKSLILTFTAGAKPSGSGWIESPNLTASFPLSATSTCGSRARLAFRAVVDPKSEPKSLIGSLFNEDCSSCAPLRFRAVRLPKAQSGGAR
jgi:hypothetical protein